MGRIKDIKGQKFTCLTAVAYSHIGSTKSGWSRGAYWKFKCDCGVEKTLCVGDVRRGSIKSCGCQTFRHRSEGRPTLPYGEASYRFLLRTYKSGAKCRGLAFDITDEAFKTLTKMDCHYCGVPPSQTWHWGQAKYVQPYVYNGLDREDNSKGYLQDNVVPCCKICNQAKHSMTQEDFFQWIDRLVAFRKTKTK